MKEYTTEGINNSLSIKDEEKNEIYDKLKVSNAQTGLSRNTPRRIISNDSSAVSKIQDLYESIFDYFNEIRIKPDKFKKIAESHGVLDIIQKVIEDSNSFLSLGLITL